MKCGLLSNQITCFKERNNKAVEENFYKKHAFQLPHGTKFIKATLASMAYTLQNKFFLVATFEGL